MVLTKQEEAYLQTLYEENIQLLKTIGKIPAPSRHEDARAVFCRDWMKNQGCSNVYIDAAKNTVCEIQCQEDRPLVLFAAHTDIVFPDTMELPMYEENGRLYAPGIGDDTANLVNLLMGLKYLLQFRPQTPYGIVIAANACEEGLGNLDGTKALMQRYGHRLKAFVSFDGYLGQCCSSAVGSYRYQLSIHASGGHSYFDFGAPSAIKMAADIIEDLYAQELPAEHKTTFNVGTIQGGTTVNTIAQDVAMLYEYRSESDRCLSVMSGKLDALLKSWQGRGVDIRADVIGIRPGNGDVDRKALQTLTERNAAILTAYAPDVPVDRAAYSTDSNIPLSMGIPANTIGTMRGGGAHTRGEWVDLQGQLLGMQIAATVMKGVLQEQ